MSQKRRSIELDQTIHASAKEIFPYLGEQDKIIKWFPTRAETDPVVGGHYMLAFEFSNPEHSDKGDHIRRGSFTRVEAPTAIGYSWDVDNTDVLFTLDEKNGMTDIHLVHSGWPADDEQAYQQHLQGWTFFLSNLKALLEQGKDRRTDELWLKAEA
jgi:uncharacterized protein YndB with AHSA1/START domain